MMKTLLPFLTLIGSVTLAAEEPVRLLGQLEGARYPVDDEQAGLRAIAGDGDGYKHLIVWRYEEGGVDEVEARLDLAGVSVRSSRVVALDPSAPVDNIKVIPLGSSDDLREVPLRLKPWDVRWIEIE